MDLANFTKAIFNCIRARIRSIFGRAGKTDGRREISDLRSNQSEEKLEQDPPNRPGERGKPTPTPPPDQPNPPPKKKPSPREKPELICRDAHNQWQILLVLPHDKTANVSQGQSQLSQNVEGEYLLENFTEGVRWQDNDKDGAIELFNGTAPLIFKLRKHWRGDGRQVKQVSNGYYLVVAPHDWQRKGNPPIEPTGCTDAKFLVHYFFSDGNNQLDGFFECDSFSSQKRFSLNGKTVVDDSDQGDLFVGESLELTDINNWQDVSWVRVGQEGGGSWNENFKPTELIKKPLTAILADREGWFYIRVYDKDVKMIDGFAFRRLVTLKEILVNGTPYSPENIIVPDTTGHTKTIIQFVGDIEVKIDNPDISKHDDAMLIAADIDADKTHWTLSGANNGQTDIVIRLPRVWWRMDNINNESGQWRDTPFVMSRAEFYENRNELIVVRLPSAARKISMGFDSFNQYDGAREYLAKRNNNGETKQAEIPLRDFSNHIRIAEHSSEESVLRMQCGEAVFSVVCILPDAPPKPEPDLPPPGEPLPTVPVLFRAELIRPITKNKRFSYAELEAAGLTIAEAKRLRVIMDCRRRTKYHGNVEVLQILKRKKET